MRRLLKRLLYPKEPRPEDKLVLTVFTDEGVFTMSKRVGDRDWVKEEAERLGKKIVDDVNRGLRRMAERDMVKLREEVRRGRHNHTED